jgi:hypothetical protein
LVVGGKEGKSLFKTFAAGYHTTGNHDQSTHNLHHEKEEKRMRGLITLVSTGDRGSGADERSAGGSTAVGPPGVSEH